MSDQLKYRIPGKSIQDLSGSFYELSSLKSYSGFLVGGFNLTHLYGFTSSNNQNDDKSNKEEPKCISKDEYLKIAETFIATLKNGDAKKIILSRIEKTDCSKSPIDIFHALEATYPDAFVYYISSHLFGTWIGATPESLLNQTADNVELVSLAGTKLASDDSNWGDKEIQEQKMVSDYIVNTISGLTSNKPSIDGPYDVKAGPVKHLKTTFNFKSQIATDELIHKLHPTPAVCGLPKEFAEEYILDNEPHDRELYAGVIGEYNNDAKLFVNLRCMQIVNDSLYLYLGGGLTVDSNPESEFDETKNKAETLLRVIKKI